MIKLVDILVESTAPDIFVPRRLGDRVERYIKQYIRNGSKGNLDLSRMDLTELPAILSNVTTVGGYFACDFNKLKSLSGAPQHVVGHFFCYSNQLESLSGAPQRVGGNFFCNNNAVKFTEAQVRAVCDVKGKIFV